MACYGQPRSIQAADWSTVDYKYMADKIHVRPISVIQLETHIPLPTTRPPQNQLPIGSEPPSPRTLKMSKIRPEDVKAEDVRPADVPDDFSDKGSGTLTPQEKAPLASRKTPYNVVTGPVTDALYSFLRIRQRKVEDLDEVATQPSVYDTAQAEFYQPRSDWEVSLPFAPTGSIRLTDTCLQNIEQFDPDFRWSWREEQKAIRKVDFKIFAWVLVMFFCLSEWELMRPARLAHY